MMKAGRSEIDLPKCKKWETIPSEEAGFKNEKKRTNKYDL